MEDEEARQWQLAMGKCRQVHTNTNTILLRIKDETVKKAKTAAHEEVIQQLKGFKTKLSDLYNVYESITINGVIPNSAEPTNSATLRKQIVEDI